MKIDSSVYHLVIFVCCLAFLAAVIITGHDTSPLVQQIIPGMFGGILGGSAAGAAPALANFISGGNPPRTQGGFVKFPLLLCVLVAVLALTACASLQSAGKSDPLAVSCATASAAIKTITPAKNAGLLSPATVTQVNNAIAVVSPVCEAPAEPTPGAAVTAAFSAALVTLQSAAAAVHSPSH